MAQKYAISSLDEAEAYLQHPILGPRLCECCRLLQAVEGRSIHDILGYPDDMKFRSSLTLFAHTKGADPVFQGALNKYFDGEPDPLTLARIRSSA